MNVIYRLHRMILFVPYAYFLTNLLVMFALAYFSIDKLIPAADPVPIIHKWILTEVILEIALGALCVFCIFIKLIGGKQ